MATPTSDLKTATPTSDLNLATPSSVDLDNQLVAKKRRHSWLRQFFIGVKQWNEEFEMEHRRVLLTKNNFGGVGKGY